MYGTIAPTSSHAGSSTFNLNKCKELPFLVSQFFCDPTHFMPKEGKKERKKRKDKNTSIQLVHVNVNVNVNVKQKANKNIPSRHGLQRRSQSN